MFVFRNPCARAELHQQKRARKLCSATLRTVPTFVSAHTFTHDTINYATKYTTKMKAKFSSVTNSRLMNLYLNQEHHNSSISLSIYCYRLPAEKLSAISLENYTEIHCKHVPADDVVRAQNKYEISNCFTF